MTESGRTTSKRLFLALWPDEEVRQQCYQLQQELIQSKRLLSAKPVARHNLHLTLHFLGAVAVNSIPALVSSLSTVRGRPFVIDINRWGCFSKPKLLWLGATEKPEELTRLLTRSQKTISRCIRGYTQKKFMTHITLFRNARPTMELDEIQTITWRIEDFVLVKSITHKEGVEYQILRKWALKNK